MWVVTTKSPLCYASPIHWFFRIIAIIGAAILCSIALQQSVFAVEATWSNGAIKYGNLTLKGPKKAPENSPLGLPKNAQYYESEPKDGKVTVAYFQDGINVAEMTSVRVAEYRFTPPDTYAKIGADRTVSIDKQSSVENGNGEQGENADKETTSCAVNGLGYVLCPLMGLIADATDRVFDFLQNFLEVRPITADNKSGLFKAWSIMRTIANIAFVIAFLVVIYSYLTGQGLREYDVRYMIPRLIVASILVNVSYYLCAIAVDASNIVGSSLQNMLYDLRIELAQNQTQNNIAFPTWGEITAYTLSGGALAAAGMLQVSAGGNIYALIPVLTVVSLAIFVTVAVLAARQAIITIFIMISPFAFVAFVLPGTQKYFDKWRDVFQTMLMMYPMFSILFGGSQLAGYMIAQSADRFEVLLIAMFVHMAPLIVTPFLIKFSGSLLGKFAGIVNDPTKGIADRAKTWATGKRDLKRAERIATNAPLSGAARWMHNQRLRDERQKKIYDTDAATNYRRTRRGRALDIEQWRADNRSEVMDNINRARYAEMKYKDKSMQLESAQSHVAKQALNLQQGKAEAFVQELQTKEGGRMHTARNAALVGVAQRMQQIDEATRVVDARKASATDTARAEFAQTMINSAALQTAAAGVGGEKGRAVAAARAVSDLYDDFGKSAKSVSQLMDHFKLSGADIEQLAMRRGEPLVKTRPDGSSFTFDFNDGYTFEAAVDKFIHEKANFVQKIELLKRTGEAEYADVRGTIVSGVKKTMMAGAPQLGGRTLDILSTTGLNTQDPAKHLLEVSRDYIQKAKVSQQALATTDADGLRMILDAIKPDVHGNLDYSGASDKMIYGAQREAFIDTARALLKNEQLNGNIAGNTRLVLEEIKQLGEVK